MAPFLPDASLKDRSRSLARSSLRLLEAVESSGIGLEGLGDDQGERLQRGMEMMLQLTDLLNEDKPLPQEGPALAEVLDQNSRQLQDLQEQILRSLTPEKRLRLRQTMLRISVSDEELHERLAQVKHRAAFGQPKAGQAVAALESWGISDPGAHGTDGLLPEEIEESVNSLFESLGMEADDEDIEFFEQIFGSLLDFFDPEEVLSDMEETWRREQEDKGISLKVGLAPALKVLPAHWVEAVHIALELPKARRKAERVAAIVGLLLDPEGLSRVLGKLDKKERQALKYLIDERGWRKTGPFCRRFGNDQEDGWFWLDNEPESVLGRLRLHGLVFVGRAHIGGRRFRVAVVPTPLRAILAKALAARP